MPLGTDAHGRTNHYGCMTAFRFSPGLGILQRKLPTSFFQKKKKRHEDLSSLTGPQTPGCSSLGPSSPTSWSSLGFEASALRGVTTRPIFGAGEQFLVTQPLDIFP